MQNAAARLVSATRRRDYITHTGPATAALAVRHAARRVPTDTVGVQGDPRALNLLPPYRYLASDCKLDTAAKRRHLSVSAVQAFLR